MKQPEDRFTLEMFERPRRGRPRKANALTPAQRARRYRDRHRAKKAAQHPLYNPAAVKYACDGMTWSGRGKPPAWVKEAIAAGKRLEDMRVS